jgi:hypothetical protein
MKILPKNISTTLGRYYRVTIERRGMIYRVTIPFGDDRAAALARAVAERDRFYAAHGSSSPRSNTGIAGISETTNWTRSVPYPCFSVTVGAASRSQPVRFHYRHGDRSGALRAAIAWRARHAGEDPAKLLAQAAEVGCV